MSRITVPALVILAALLPPPLLAHPGSGIVVDRLGQVYFVDTGAGLWKIDTLGKLTRIGDPRFHWLAIDADDTFAAVRLPSGSAGDVTRVGARPTLLLASDWPLTIASDGKLYYPLRASAQSVDLVQLSTTRNRSVLTRIPLPWLNGLASGPAGSLYYTDNRSIMRIDSKGQISPVKENLILTGCALIPGNASSEGPLLRGLAVDPGETIYVAASGCGQVVKITPGGEVTRVVQTESPWSPTAVALFKDTLYVLEYLHTAVEDRSAWVPRVRKVLSDGTSSIIATVTR